eukprot:CAMPEP_0178375214 /NCGR_PEP_ID=MMETSP0689_2-20121128/2771_1 /TAXON_ID=160604 /ORGANISM="Amphidinium massartii, Strain CS-259" /LENGTH=53 /DNA_ID=CAMNT_0019995197 /DNA_START=127 /DNA_END=288 /DNA_ORIENTATION=-
MARSLHLFTLSSAHGRAANTASLSQAFKPSGEELSIEASALGAAKPPESTAQA